MASMPLSETRSVRRRTTRRLALGWLGAALSSGACVAGSNQPLTVVTQSPAGSAGATTGAAGSPTGSAGATTGAAGAATGSAGTTGIAITGAAGATAGGVPGGSACWSSELPLEPLPPQPLLSVDDACTLGVNAASWTFPTTWTGTSSIKNDDENRTIVGRWVACGAATVVPSPHVGIEFGGNGRWQTLKRDASGALVPLPDRGYYYVLGNGQLNIGPEGFVGSGGGFVVFANGNRDVARFDGVQGAGGIYARVAPSPTNGDENVPSVSNGRCSMVGSWAVPANVNTPVEPASVWSFDDAGHFVVSAPGDVLCGSHAMWGTYRLPPDNGFFQITSNWNLGLCDWWFTAAYPYNFSADCATLVLTQMVDNCTGGRGYLNGTTTLRRRP
jgi:hypothetical protein